MAFWSGSHFLFQKLLSLPFQLRYSSQLEQPCERQREEPSDLLSMDVVQGRLQKNMSWSGQSFFKVFHFKSLRGKSILWQASFRASWAWSWGCRSALLSFTTDHIYNIYIIINIRSNMLRFVEPKAFAKFSVYQICWMLIDLYVPSQVERSAYCRDVIAARVSEGHFGKNATIHDNVETFELSAVGERVSGLTGGFPCQAGLLYMSSFIQSSCCQGNSRAGLKRGLSDPRTALVSHFFRLWDSVTFLFLVCSYDCFAAVFAAMFSCDK